MGPAAATTEPPVTGALTAPALEPVAVMDLARAVLTTFGSERQSALYDYCCAECGGFRMSRIRARRATSVLSE